MTRAAAAPTASPQGGWSIFETMIAIGIIATGLMVMVQQLSLSFRESNNNEHRAFAYQKAAALLGEIHNAIVLGQITTSDDLMALVDGPRNPVLTTRRDAESLPFAPEHPMSGNVQRQGQWLWSRTITASPHESPGLYYCRVVVERREDNGTWRLEASHAQLFSLLPSTDAPEQVHDVYLLACGEAPSLWSDLAELRAQVEGATAAIVGQSQARLRLHWITRLGYGRDPCYQPFVNSVRQADGFAPAAYWLPGALGGSLTGELLYRTELLAGVHRTELGAVHTGEALPTAIADRNNHCLRTPAAWSLFGARLAAGLERADEPPLQLLLDDLHQRPERYRNAIFVNLHGRGLPLPPLRNVSDPAKDPTARPGVRVVTHPARLWTPRDPNNDGSHADSLDLELRVYAYRTTGSGDVLTEPITVQIYGGNFTGAINAASGATLQIHRMQGGVDTSSGTATGLDRSYVGFDAIGGAAPTVKSKPYEMWFNAGYVSGAEPYTWIKLYNTPLVAPTVGTGGLDAGARLYGWEYCPSAIDGAFTADLAKAGTGAIPRNTARWRIRVPKTVFGAGLLANSDQAVRVVTRIGEDFTTGQRWPVANEPLNRSETWGWWSRSPAAVPATERYQFAGDPRLCPYADLLSGGASYPNGYNWNFDNLRTATADATPLWPGLQAARLQDGFCGGPHADAPRLLQLLRSALQSAGAVFVAPTGPLAHTLLLGGEIAARNGATTTGIALHPSWTGSELGTVDTIQPGSGTGALVLRDTSTGWWAKPWAGELFPDSLGAAWITAGNLPIAGTSLRWSLQHTTALADLPTGTAFTAASGGVMGDAGGLMLVNCGTLLNTWQTMAITTTTQSAAAPAEAINAATNLVPPTGLQATAVVSPDAKYLGTCTTYDFVDSYPRSTATTLESQWNAGAAGSTAQLLRWSGVGTAFLCVWQAPTGAANVREVMRQSLLLGLRGLHAGGKPSVVGRIQQIPQLTIIEPTAGSSRTDPDQLTVRWQTAWKRFDDQPYTTDHPPTFSESEGGLVYRVLWSADDGVNWTSALTEEPTAPGVWPADLSERLADVGTGTESFTFPWPSGLPTGDYVVLVEAWRADNHCHDSTHQVKFHVRRTL